MKFYFVYSKDIHNKKETVQFEREKTKDIAQKNDQMLVFSLLIASKKT